MYKVLRKEEPKNPRRNINIIQKMAVNPLPSNSQEDSVETDVWAGKGTKLTGKLYRSKILLPDEKSKPEILKHQAEIASQAGSEQKIQNAISNNIWTSKQNDMNKQTISTVDPCRILLRAGDQDNRIEAEWHFGGYNQGYVMMVKDAAAKGNKTARLTDEKHDEAVKHTGTGSTNNEDMYSERHTQTTGKLIDIANKVRESGTSDDDLSTAWDTHTKLLGEGARWNFIQRNISSIQEDTYIWTRGTNSEVNNASVTNPGIKFKDLWSCWSSVFKKEFGIPNTIVKTKLLGINPWPKSYGNTVSLDPVTDSMTNKIEIT